MNSEKLLSPLPKRQKILFKTDTQLRQPSPIICRHRHYQPTNQNGDNKNCNASEGKQKRVACLPACKSTSPFYSVAEKERKNLFPSIESNQICKLNQKRQQSIREREREVGRQGDGLQSIMVVAVKGDYRRIRRVRERERERGKMSRQN